MTSSNASTGSIPFDRASPLWAVLLVLAAAFLSYDVNLFQVAADDWFVQHQADSEQYVLDGILHAEQTGVMRLGRYLRADNERPRELYANADRSGAFTWYKSQYGLQGKVFYLAARAGLGSSQALQALAASAFGVVVALLFVVVGRDFGPSAAAAFAAALILSPTLVVMARNLYWVPFTWFVPLLVAQWKAPAVFAREARAWALGAWLFGAYLVKLLCGYEYMTTMFVATCAPLVYHAMRRRPGRAMLLRVFGLDAAAFLGAFVVAIGLHALEISDGDGSGLHFIELTAQKRLASSAPEQVAHEACEGDPDPRCEEKISASLASNRVKVATRYLFFADFLPWLGHAELPDADKNALAQGGAGHGMQGVAGAVRSMSGAGIAAAARMGLGAAAFLALTAALAWSWRRMSGPQRALLVTAFLAPLSWYVLAKGHSSNHYHINYVLWSLPFVPYGVCVLWTLHFSAPRPPS